MKSAASVGIVGLLLMCITLKCKALEVGQIAKDDADCLSGYGQQICHLLFEPVCATLRGRYINGSNICDFCSKYGNTNAQVLQIGFQTRYRDFSCTGLEVGKAISNDPECNFMYGRRECTRELYPICATTDNFRTYIKGSNKCTFCSEHGNKNGLILTMGRRLGRETICASFQIGTKANLDPGCKYLATRTEKFCTLEYIPICGVLNGQPIKGGNKCAFCTEYGNTDAIITKCPQMHRG